MPKKTKPNQDPIQYQDSIQAQLKALPPNEFSYYITVLLASIKNTADPKKYSQLLFQTQQLVDTMVSLHQDPSATPEKHISEINEQLKKLIAASKMQTIPQKIKDALLAVIGSVLAIIIGILGAVTGLLVGFFTDYTVIGNIRNAGFGFLYGLAFGSLIGYRIPTKLCQSAIETKLKFCIENLVRVHGELKNKKPYETYKQETKAAILKKYFADTPDDKKEEAFQKFLDSTDLKFRVGTTTAQFVSRKLKGHVGHHSLISFEINAKRWHLELGFSAKTPNFFDQFESVERTVTGKKLFEMLILDRILQETHTGSMAHRGGFACSTRIYSLGADDCRNYVDKILIGTGQEPTKISRFTKNDSWLGRKFTAGILNTFNRMKEDELHCLIKDPQHANVEAYPFSDKRDLGFAAVGGKRK